LGVWIGVLVLTYGCFLLYNRIDKMTRVWLYPLLQLARGAAFAAVVPIEPAGAAALAAHVLSRWIPYQFYRLSSTRWPGIRLELVRLISFLLLISLIGCAAGFAAVTTWAALALLAWNIVRARRDIYAVLKSARRIDRPAKGAPASEL
jgi:hypothetical protein